MTLTASRSIAATTAGHEGGTAFFSPTTQETRIRAPRACHRPTQERRSGKKASDEDRGASSAQGVEQPWRELPSIHKSSRATDATIQIPRASPTLSFYLWTDSRPLPPQTTSTHSDSAIANRCANELPIGEKSLG